MLLASKAPGFIHVGIRPHRTCAPLYLALFLVRPRLHPGSPSTLYPLLSTLYPLPSSTVTASVSISVGAATWSAATRPTYGGGGGTDGGGGGGVSAAAIAAAAIAAAALIDAGSA